MNLLLVGFMASGKTAVGRRLARRLGYGFVDTDRWIEQEVGCTIAQLFESHGEPYFRRLETELASHLHKLKNHIVSTGGGILTAEGNLELLRRAGLVIFLNADLEEILERLERDTHRPKLMEGELRETVTRLLGERMPVYLQAEIALDTKGKSANRVAGDIIRLVARRKGEPEPAPGE
ncbi:MAG: shikimate kinase [bacterium]